MDYGTLIDGVSRERLQTYLGLAAGNEALALELYKKNLDICGSLYCNLHWVEITLRNAINKELTIAYGAMWFDCIKLGDIECSKIERAKQQVLKEGKILDRANIVSNLTFGFWVSLFNGRYENLWRHSLRRAFKYSSENLKRSAVSSRLHPLLKLRNRVAHYESVIGRNLAEDKARIFDIVSWLVPEFSKELKHIL